MSKASAEYPRRNTVPPFGLNTDELRALLKLTTPARIQDFINTLDINFEPNGDTCMSPRRVLREGRAHCTEGAMLAALALRLHGQAPCIMDLKSHRKDFDHVVALFRIRGRWGAISKTNHAVLRYREPVYQTVRELAMSYFHEYFLDTGKKTMQSYSHPFNLSRFDARDWVTAEDDLWYIPTALDETRHFPVAPQKILRAARKADRIEIIAGKLVEQKRFGRRGKRMV